MSKTQPIKQRAMDLSTLAKCDCALCEPHRGPWVVRPDPPELLKARRPQRRSTSLAANHIKERKRLTRSRLRR